MRIWDTVDEQWCPANIGLTEIVIAFGAESMSTAPYYLRKARYDYGAGNGMLLDST